VFARIAFGSDAAVGPVEICVTVEMKVRQGEDEEKIDNHGACLLRVRGVVAQQAVSREGSASAVSRMVYPGDTSSRRQWLRRWVVGGGKGNEGSFLSSTRER